MQSLKSRPKLGCFHVAKAGFSTTRAVDHVPDAIAVQTFWHLGKKKEPHEAARKLTGSIKQSGVEGAAQYPEHRTTQP